jgi:RimJ/RimL family protein N-acetyltransferase
VYRGPELVHRSGVYPGFARFPFMAPDDLQIGDTWTAPDARGRGIAQAAIAHIVVQLARPGRRFWYLCETANAPSIAVVERMGFRRVARGAKYARLSLLALGQYVMTTELGTPAAEGQW